MSPERRHQRWLGTLALLLLTLGPALAASEIVITEHHGVVRPGLPWRVEVARQPAANESGPRLLIVSLEQHDERLAVERVPLADVAQLADGVVCHLVPGRLDPAPATVRVIVEGGAGMAEESTRAVTTWPQLVAAVDQRVQELTVTGRPHPLLALHIEQAALLLQRPPTLACTATMQRFAHSLGEEPQARRDQLGPDGGLLAVRCPVDGSVQPLRVSLPEAAPRGVVHLCLQHAQPPDKSDWPQQQPAWVAQATATGFAVIEWYPAGDRHWQGVARTRLRLRWREVVADLGWSELPQFAVGGGSGCHAVLDWARREPASLAGILLHDLPTRSAPAAPAATTPMVRSWLRERYELPERAPGLPTVVCGQLPASWSRQAHLHRVPDSPTTPEVWRWLLARHQLGASTGIDRMVRVFEPGDFGAVRVEALQAWGQPGELIIDHDADGALRVRTTGVAAWHHAGAQERLVSAADLRAIRKRFGRATGPLDAYADGPFVVVVGRGGHLAGREQARHLAEAFLADWVAHAQGAAAWVWDDAYRPEDWPGHDLVCIGGRETNRVLAGLMAQDPDFPIGWDHRSVGTAATRLLTSQPHSLAVAWPHPADDGRLLVVLAGAASWPRGGERPPLAGWPDLVLAPGAGYMGGGKPPAPIARLFDNRWQEAVTGDDAGSQP